MPLEQFFSEGNKIAVVGSIIYSSETANDVDFTLFTRNAVHNFPCSPQYDKKVKEFFRTKFGDKKLDYIDGRFCIPYDVDCLPDDDIMLDGYFLTGQFFPSDDFIDAHYQQLFGDRFLVEPWVRFAEYVKHFQLREIRTEKPQKNLSLMLAATERIVSERGELGPLVGNYRKALASTTESYRNKELLPQEFNRTMQEMVQSFISEAKDIVH